MDSHNIFKRYHTHGLNESGSSVLGWPSLDDKIGHLFLFFNIPMAQFKIEYGVGGGYNDITEEVIEADNLDQANQIAYESSIEVFDSYGIFENQNDPEDYEGLSPEDAHSAYLEEVERWVVYNAESV